MNSLSDNALVQNDGNVEKVFNDLSKKELAEMKFKVWLQEVEYEQPDLSTQLMLNNSGTLNKPDVDVKPSKEFAVQIHSLLPGTIKVTKLNCTQLQSVDTKFSKFSFWGMCVS